MFTDIVGFTALSQRNESLALQLLEKHRSLMRPLFVRHNGREIKTIGDAFLVQFDSALEAVECAVQMQESIHNQGESSPEKLEMKIGIHVGDVVQSDKDVHGDAVNIASRIEPLAKGGEICISGQVFDQVRNKVPFKLVKLESHQLKNVEVQIDVYKVELPWDAPSMGSIPVALPPDRIAVLPFVSMSPDPNDEYFADGMTEELITRLYEVKGLEVIARTSVMNYKKKEQNLAQIGKELNVGSIIEGSVRKAGNKIRVTAQLINTNTLGHLWASNFDRNLDDIFAVQSEIAAKVAEALPATIIEKKVSVSGKKEVDNIVAYTYFLQGRQILQTEGADHPSRALELFEKAVEIENSFARAYVGIAECHGLLSSRGKERHEEAVKKMKSAASKALTIDDGLAEAHATMAQANWMADDIEGARSELRRAIELNPSLARAYFVMCLVEATHGSFDESVRLLEAASRLDPLEPRYVGSLGGAYVYAGRESEALDQWRRAIGIAPYIVHSDMFAFHLVKKEYGKAAESLKKIQELRPSSPVTIGMTAYLAAVTGDKDAALRCILELEKIASGGSSIALSWIGFIHYALGDMDRFIEYMERVAAVHALLAIDLRFSPLFSKARGDPRLHKVFESTGTPLPNWD